MARFYIYTSIKKTVKKLLNCSSLELNEKVAHSKDTEKNFRAIQTASFCFRLRLKFNNECLIPPERKIFHEIASN